MAQSRIEDFFFFEIDYINFSLFTQKLPPLDGRGGGHGIYNFLPLLHTKFGKVWLSL